MFQDAVIADKAVTSDSQLAHIMMTADHCRNARSLLDWTREQLADKAGVSPGSVKNIELGRNTLRAIAAAVERTLTEAGVQFIHDGDDGGGEGVRFRLPASERPPIEKPSTSASKPKKAAKPAPPKKPRQRRP